MKKILVVCQHFWPENFRLNDICDGFVERGYEVEVLCGLPNYPAGKIHDGYGVFRNRKQVHNGIKIRRVLEIPRGNNSNLRIFLNYVSFPFFSLFHLPYLLTQKYDKIFLYQLSPVMMSFVGLLLGKLKKIETTMYVLDLWPENLFSVLDIKNTMLRKIAAVVSHWHYKKADKLISISPKMNEVLKKITGKDDRQVLCLPQFCEKLYETPIVDEELVQRFSSTFNLVFAGNLSPAQSLETILTVAERLKKKGFKNIKWIIVGDGMSRQWMENQVLELGLSDVFSFEGSHPMTDIPKYTNIADGLVATLKKSDMLDCTIPAKVMSYFASGTPILLAMDGDAQQMVNEIGCGFAGPADDCDALYENICKLYRLTKDERNNMGAKGQAYHFKHFERNISIDKMLAFIFSDK